jgi:hypothetical protein
VEVDTGGEEVFTAIGVGCWGGSCGDGWMVATGDGIAVVTGVGVTMGVIDVGGSLLLPQAVNPQIVNTHRVR